MYRSGREGVKGPSCPLYWVPGSILMPLVIYYLGDKAQSTGFSNSKLDSIAIGCRKYVISVETPSTRVWLGNAARRSPRQLSLAHIFIPSCCSITHFFLQSQIFSALPVNSLIPHRPPHPALAINLKLTHEVKSRGWYIEMKSSLSQETTL